MGVNSLPKTVMRQRRGCDLNPGPSAPESCTLPLGYRATLSQLNLPHYHCARVSEHWTDTLLYVKNIGENVTEEQLKEVFIDAEDVVIPKPDVKKKDDKKTR